MVPTVDDLIGDPQDPTDDPIERANEDGNDPIESANENGNEPLESCSENGDDPIESGSENDQEPIESGSENDEGPIEDFNEDQDEPIQSSSPQQRDEESNAIASSHGMESYLFNYAFNQDCTCFSVSTSTDFRTFTLSPRLVEISRRPFPGVNTTTMLFQTNYVALVTRDSPYKVLLWDDRLGTVGHHISSRFEVLNVLLRRDVVVVVSEYKLYVYEFGNEFGVQFCYETCSNPRGLCVLNPGGQSWILAAPGPAKGSIRIQLGLDDSISSTVMGHTHSIAHLGINKTGSLVASASEAGTVIKVFSSIEGQLLHEFRRGNTATRISSIVFRLDSKFLVVGSSSLTVHIFKCSPGDATSQPRGSIYASLGKVAEWAKEQASSSQSSSAVPSSSPSLVPTPNIGLKIFQANRSYAIFRIPDKGTDLRVVKSSPIGGPIVSFCKEQPNRLFIVHLNGLMYQIAFDDNRSDYGQECLLIGASAYFQARPEFHVSNEAARSDELWEVI